MQKIIDFDKKSKKILNHIRDDLEDLIAYNKENDKNLEQLKHSINLIQNELNKLQNKFENKSETPKKEENNLQKETQMQEQTNDLSSKIESLNTNKANAIDDNQTISKKLTVKKTKRSNSFKNWLFSNNEL